MSLKKDKRMRICCTSLEQKLTESIKIIAEKLGAIFEENLTFETRILIAGSVNSTKYRV